MLGFITDNELGQADQEFPGIALFFQTLPIKPHTFLELVARFEHWCGDNQPRSAAVSTHARQPGA